MTCRLTSSVNSTGTLSLETPLVRAAIGYLPPDRHPRRGRSAATREPSEISARNIFPGRVVSVERKDVIIVARVQSIADPQVQIAVQLTLAARDSLRLTEGREVWLVIKTHSCHLMGR